MDLHLALNLLHFLPDLGALHALRRASNLYDIHPRLDNNAFQFPKIDPYKKYLLD
jgi:hypothetical protein